jgi:methylenetetrahydrofolate dehydrogenase (NADP+)/methenyltetrahydrofolate cyclohydrolase
MSAVLIDGKTRAAALRAEVATGVAAFVAAHGRAPGLTVVLVGDDPASAVYVGSKGKATREAGMISGEYRLPADTSEADLLALVATLNADPAVDGILVQMPLPKQIDSDRVIAAIDPAKDVDGLHPINTGLLVSGRDGLVPCTPSGCMLLINEAFGGSSGGNIAGAEAVVIGRSILVGKPMAALLTNASATVTVAHSRTRDLAGHVARADIVVAAVGIPGMVKGEWIKPGACVIDVGINRVEAPGTEKGYKLVGDVAFDEVAPKCKAITPVPGGVGPMTIAMLMANTIKACKQA